MIADNLTAVFNPFPWQVDPWRDTSPVMLLSGASNAGRSHLAAEKIHGLMLAYPGACALVLRKAREYCAGSVGQMLETVIGDDPHVHYTKSDGVFRYDNESIIYMGGMKDKDQRESIRSKRGKYGDPDFAWMEEASAFTRLDFDELANRTRGNRAGWSQVILTTNPDHPHHWIYTDLIVGGQAANYSASIDDNPRATEAQRARLDNLTGVLRLRLRDGKWVQAEGAIYSEFDPNIHMIDADQCPEFVRRFRVVDFGYSNPFVCQWWGLDSDGRLYRYRELYVTKKLVEDLTPEILRLGFESKFKRKRYDGAEYEISENDLIEETIADHDAEDRATMEKHGISTSAAQKDVSPGIQAVKARLKVQADGKPRIFFVRGALVEADPLLEAEKKPTCTEQEIPGYSWKRYDDGKPNKEEPIKVNDHGCDCMRYLVARVDGLPDVTKMISWA